MIRQYERYYEAEVLTLGGTDKWELPENGILAGVKLDFRARNGNGLNTLPNNSIVDRMTEIKISDGGTRTFFTMRGQEIRALHRLENSRCLPETANFEVGKSQLTTLYIPFGRDALDYEFAFDLSKNPSIFLEITNDAGLTQFVGESLNVDIQLVWLTGDMTTPKEYIKYFTWRENKPRADGQHVYHEISPLDPLYLIMTQLDPDLEDTGCATNDPSGDSYNVKFTLDERNLPLWDHRPKDIMRMNAAQYGVVMTQLRPVPSTTQFFDNRLASLHSFADSAIDANNDHLTWHDTNNRFIRARTVAVEGSPELAAMLFEGVGYYHTMALYHAIGVDRSKWLNPNVGIPGSRGPVRLDVYGHRDDFTVRTVLGTPKAQGTS